MTTIEDYTKTLRSVVAAHRRPKPVLTNAEIKAITEAAKPFFDAYEAMIAEAKSNAPGNGPAWYGYANDGSEYTGDQKQEILHEWMKEEGIPDEKSLLRATLGERSEGPRARGPITFYTYPSPNGIVALWVAKSDNLTLLKSMVASSMNEEEGTDEPGE